ncbi:MAG: adenosine kinase [Gemmatimonadetes bacterium]|nr:adenosine kinase [Gemmatimonadota bacterium]MYC73455.1 adenosine kinase [Gemmatimonadota bacterium]MYI62451.1 adenosine kinase [Gemmatimonadota bacterium]
MTRTYDVYGVGHALVDIQYQVPPEFLAEHQIEKGVMTLVDEERQRHLTTAVDGEPVASASGGSVANTLIGVARYGGRTYYACLTGRDAWGDFYQRDLEAAGVTTHPANRGVGKTGQCLVFVTPDAERTLNTFLGISSAIGPAQLHEEVIADSQYVYIEGYLLGSDDGFAAARRAQQMAQLHGTAVALTLSDPFAVRAFRARFDALLQDGVDLLFCNEEEALASTGTDNREAAGAALASQVGTAYVTCGADGALVYADGTHQVPGVPVQAIDTNGAGDLFAGGVLYGLSYGYSPLDAARLGCYAAAQVVTRFGPRLEQSLANHIDLILSHFST